MKMDGEQSWVVAVMARVGLFSTKNWMSWSWKGANTVSVQPLQYLPGCRRKRNAIQKRSDTFLLVVGAALCGSFKGV